LSFDSEDLLAYVWRLGGLFFFGGYFGVSFLLFVC